MLYVSILIAIGAIVAVILLNSGVEDTKHASDAGVGKGIPSAWEKITPTGARSPHARLAHAACSVGSNKMYIHGGLYGRTTQTFNDLWVYDEVKNEWTELATTGDVPSARLHHTLVDTADDKHLLLFGGFNSFQGQAGHDSFDDLYKLELATLKWTRLDTVITALKPTKRGAHDCIWLGSQQHGGMYCFGGFPVITATGHSDEMWKYDLNTNTWTDLTPAASAKFDWNWPDGRIGFALSQISDTKAHIFGGGCAGNDAVAGQCGDDWIFDITTNKFERMNLTKDSATPGPRRAPHGDISACGQVFLYGGLYMDGTSKPPKVQMFDDMWALQPDPAKGGPRWTKLELTKNADTPPKLFGHSVVRLDNTVVLFGGREGSPMSDGGNTVWEYLVKPMP